MNNIEKVALGTVLATTIVGGAALVSGNKVDAATQSTYKTTANLNMRSGPSTLYAKIGSIPNGSTVTVLDYKDGWCKIKYGRTTGYCSSAYLVKNNTNSNSTKTVNNKVETTSTTYKTTANLNMRSGPSTLYTVIGGIPKGGTVTVLDYKDGWCKIKYGRTTGYCSSTYLVKNNTNSAVANNNQMLKTLSKLVIVNQSKHNMTLSYYSNGILVKSFHCATGKASTPTPNTIYKVIDKEKNRMYYTKQIPGGSPRNPLGTRFIQLTSSGYAIHGTNDPSSIGKKVSNGCIRLKNSDVEWLYDMISRGTTVIVISDGTNKDGAKKYGIRIY